MTDIVEQLRHPVGIVTARAGENEAADEIERLRAALNEIACWKDKFANRGLANIGTYSGFDEPGSVKIAREALAVSSTDGNTSEIAKDRQ